MACIIVVALSDRSSKCYGLFIGTHGSIEIFVSDGQFTGACVGVFTENGNNSTVRMTRVTFQDTRCKSTALSLGNVKNGIIDNLLMFNSKEQVLGMLDSNVTLQGTFINNTGGVLVYQSTLLFASNSVVGNKLGSLAIAKKIDRCMMADTLILCLQ